MLLYQSTAYGWLMLSATVLSLAFWFRLARRDDRLVVIFVAALGGGFVGAKLVYLAAEGWLHWGDSNRWLVLATGKSITGALLGGYAAVELAKRFLSYTTATGDWFAVITAFSTMLGRIGCALHGCCLGRTCHAAWFTVQDAQGVPRWPAAMVELLFNGFALAVLLLLRRGGILPGQHFHLYLMAYGCFRFTHEFARETPRILGPFSGYQIAAAAVVLLGALGFIHRQRHPSNSIGPVQVRAEGNTG